MRRSVECIISRTALNCLVIYDHHWKSSITFQKIKFLLQMPFYGNFNFSTETGSVRNQNGWTEQAQ